VLERTKELEDAQSETFDRLAMAAEFRDDDTGEHTKRVGSMAAMIAHVLGLPEDDVFMLRRAAALHDVGKIGIPDDILLAPRKLTFEEFQIVKPTRRSARGSSPAVDHPRSPWPRGSLGLITNGGTAGGTQA
jgi:response regulator RpfG family c-di-GMP phosphodiesterase